MKFSGKVWSDHGTTWFNFGSIRIHGSAGRRSSCLLSPAIAQSQLHSLDGSRGLALTSQLHSGSRGRGLLCLAPQLVIIVLCRRQQLKDSSGGLLTDSVSSKSSRDSPDDVNSRCSTVTSDVMPQLHNSQTDDITVASRADTVPTLHSDTVPPTILLTDGTVPEAPLDYRSMLVGAALARQQMMTSLNRDSRHHYQSNYQYQHHRYSRRFTPYVITNGFIPTSFTPE